MNESSSLAPRWQKRLFTVSVIALVVSGLGQMPLFKRYYIADIPGLGWTADFFIQHVVHYAAAGMFLFLVTFWATGFLRHHLFAYRLTLWGWLRIGSLSLLIGSGFFRILKNLPQWSFSPEATMLIGWAHLAAAMIFGLLALGARLVGNSSYLAPIQR
jgi:hypothetical protein